MKKEHVKTELSAIFHGSGRQVPAVMDWLDNHQTNGVTRSYDNSMAMYYFPGYVVVVHPYGYDFFDN